MSRDIFGLALADYRPDLLGERMFKCATLPHEGIKVNCFSAAMSLLGIQEREKYIDPFRTGHVLKFLTFRSSCSANNIQINIGAPLLAIQPKGSRIFCHLAIIYPDDPSRVIHRPGYGAPLIVSPIDEMLWYYVHDGEATLLFYINKSPRK